MFIKICGVKTERELNIVEKYADATGVIVESESKRRISLDRAKELIETSSIPVFTVSTLEDFKSWSEVIEKTETEYIQIHSDMDVGTVERLKDEYSVFIMKVFKVPKRSTFPERDAEDLINKIAEYKDIVDRILLDTGKGCGVTHDHRVSKIICKKFDVVLAGGLNPENVREIVDYVQPFGVDVSSGVEKEGEKSEDLIRSFVESLKMI
ncbi:phosphoribosylanthranilate isomerase [Methanofervidicoccus sp. A16]|uniref:phosphoribosylanthranilate isomerase n=1 Tax=Methanofervidicoccus sp. A16 TaxID=2607662 RepID=UPI00118D4EFB|nr:phosphoribosylanthranilate isomerase [Methanofervidicoccus sp. A16]AXI25083.1 phosphoribosylanthranilate isomerase [Methanofervidicoccus sp. A16]